MRYEVRFVSDHSLPAGVTWAFARQAGEAYLFVKSSAIDPVTGRCEALDRAREVWYGRAARAAA
jgi:hypothetical protein